MHSTLSQDAAKEAIGGRFRVRSNSSVAVTWFASVTASEMLWVPPSAN
jgi:hypothetical protein